MTEDVAILEYIHKHSSRASHTLAIFACDRDGATNTFRCRPADRYSVPAYTSETKTTQTTKLSTPLIVRKGRTFPLCFSILLFSPVLLAPSCHLLALTTSPPLTTEYIGVTDKSNLEFCSLRQTNDWSVKENNDEAFYYSNFVKESDSRVLGKQWQGALSFGFTFGSCIGKKSNNDVYTDRQRADRQRAASVERRTKAASSTGTPNYVNWTGVQWTNKATTGWSVKTALLGSDPAVHDG